MWKSFLVPLSVFAVLLITPASTVQAATGESTLPSPKDGQALLVFVRSWQFGGGGGQKYVSLDGELACVLHNGTFAYRDVAPGEHIVESAYVFSRTVSSTDRADIIIHAEAGRTYGVEFEVSVRPHELDAADLANAVGKSKGVAVATKKQETAGELWAQGVKEMRPLEWFGGTNDAAVMLRQEIRAREAEPPAGWRAWIAQRLREGVPTEKADKPDEWVRPRRGTLGEEYLLGVGLFEASSQSRDNAMWLESAEHLERSADRLGRLSTIIADNSPETSKVEPLGEAMRREALQYTGSSGWQVSLGPNAGAIVTGKEQDALRRSIKAETASCREHAVAARKAATCLTPDADAASVSACLHQTLAPLAASDIHATRHKGERGGQ